MKHSIRAVFSLFLFMSFVVPASAQQLSLLPSTLKSIDECYAVIQNYEVTGDIVIDQKALDDYASAKKDADNAYTQYSQAISADEISDLVDKKKVADEKANAANDAQKKAGVSDLSDPTKLATVNDVLGCAIKTGRVSLQMVPYFITYISNFLLSIVGLISILFIVIGGYQYIAGGLTDEKTKAKQYIYHALLGMGIAIMAWVIVNMVITIITS